MVQKLSAQIVGPYNAPILGSDSGSLYFTPLPEFMVHIGNYLSI